MKIYANKNKSLHSFFVCVDQFDEKLLQCCAKKTCQWKFHNKGMGFLKRQGSEMSSLLSGIAVMQVRKMLTSMLSDGGGAQRWGLWSLDGCIYSIYSDMIASHFNTTVLCVWYLNPPTKL